ncbi:MAG: hypothetical protein JWQ49_1925 [Edaphobacter sp.]|nr:hypothetical protein [Edaphobacter sp.]
MKPAQFVLEDHFQQLLEDHPELLAGDLIDPVMNPVDGY